MAAIFCDSYDHYATAQITKKWNFNSSGQITSSVSRTGAQSALFDGAGGFWLTIDSALNKTMIMGTAINTTLGGEFMGFCSHVAVPFDVCYLNIGDGGILQFIVRVPSGAAIYSAPASSALHAGVWYSVQAKVVMRTDATGSVEVRLNNIPVITQTNIVTVDSSFSSVPLFCIGGGGGGTVTYHDDTWLCDSTGTHNNDFLGDAIVVEQVPNADGHYTEWTPTGSSTHANNVNTIPPDTSKYNSSETNGQRDTYTCPAPTIALPATVPFRQALYYAEKDLAGARTMAPLLRQAGSDYLSPTDVSPSLNAFLFARQVFDINPVTAAVWTTGDLTACEIGQQITS